jgi:hypothetical protein
MSEKIKRRKVFLECPALAGHETYCRIRGLYASPIYGESVEPKVNTPNSPFQVVFPSGSDSILTK